MTKTAQALQANTNEDLATQAALAEIKPALKRALSFLNLPMPELDWESKVTRVKTPFEVAFAFQFETTSTLVRGDVNPGDVPVVNRSQVTTLRDALRSSVVAKYTSDEALRSRISTADLKDKILSERDFAVVRETCGGCSGHGTLTCRPCAGHGEMRCTNCITGWVNCTACSGTGGTRDAPCIYCNGEGRKRCPQCDGTLQAICNSCRSAGEHTCSGCSGAGVVCTVWRATFSSAATMTAGPTALSDKNLTSLKYWVQAAFPDKSSDDDGINLYADVNTASVSKGNSDLDFKVSFNCYSTVSRLEFMYEGKKAWGEYSKATFPFSSVSFSNFLDGKAGQAVEAGSRGSSPSGIREALKASGFSKVAECFEEKPENFMVRVSSTTNGAVSEKAMTPLKEHYERATQTFSKKAMRRAWKFPVLIGIGGWAAACHYDIPQAVSQTETPLAMAALAGAAGLVTLIASSLEARRAIRIEAGSVKGRKFGPTGIVIAIATAALFWTSSNYGFRI